MEGADYAWTGLASLVMAYWMVYDFLLAPRFGWPSMSGRMRFYLHQTVLGPVIFALLVAIPAAFLYHIFQTFAKQR